MNWVVETNLICYYSLRCLYHHMVLLVASCVKAVCSTVGFIFVFRVCVIKVVVIGRDDRVRFNTVGGVRNFAFYVYFEICTFSYVQGVKANLYIENTSDY